MAILPARYALRMQQRRNDSGFYNYPRIQLSNNNFINGILEGTFDLAWLQFYHDFIVTNPNFAQAPLKQPAEESWNDDRIHAYTNVNDPSEYAGRYDPHAISAPRAQQSYKLSPRTLRPSLCES